MVGAVGIENNTDWNLEDLEEMQGNAKSLNRNNREFKGILIAPQWPLVCFEPTRFQSVCLVSVSKVGFGPNPTARMASRHMNLGKSAEGDVSTTYKAVLGAFGNVWGSQKSLTFL